MCLGDQKTWHAAVRRHRRADFALIPKRGRNNGCVRPGYRDGEKRNIRRGGRNREDGPHCVFRLFLGRIHMYQHVRPLTGPAPAMCASGVEVLMPASRLASIAPCQQRALPAARHHRVDHESPNCCIPRNCDALLYSKRNSVMSL